jgi:hypothetical protein
VSLAFPRDLVFEAFLPGLGWVDLASYLSQTTSVTVTRGRRGEQARPAPGTLTARLDDRTGNMTPGNPTGAYYGLLGQYTPVRLSVRMGADPFSRVVVNGHGSSPTDGPWSIAGGVAGDYAVDGSKATHTIAATNSKRQAWLGDLSYLRNYEVRVRLPALVAPGSGTVKHGLMLRGAVGSYLTANCHVTSASEVQLSQRYRDDNTYAVPPFAVGTLTGGHVWYLAAQVEGQAVRAKLWDATAGPEPYEWTASFNDDGFFVAPAGPTGWLGLRSESGTSAASLTYAYDDLEIRSVRFYGEAAEFLPQWDESHRVRWVDFTASDLTRRMGSASNRRAKSAIQRYVELNPVQPVAYWPLDDGQLSTVGKVAVGSGFPAIINFPSSSGLTTNFTPGLAFGTGDLAPWLNPTGKIEHGTFTRCAPNPAFSGDWTVHALLRFVGRYEGAALFDSFNFGSLTLPAGFWSVLFDSQAQQILVTRPDTGATLSTINTVVFDDALHHAGFRTVQNGGNVDWTLFIDGAVAASGTAAGLTNPTHTRTVFSQGAFGGSDDIRARIVGHVVIYAGSGPPVAEVYDAMLGHPGERAGRRAERICAEEGIPFAYVGDLDDTEPMGPQFQDTVLDALNECAETDRALLIASRSSTGFVFCTYRSLTQPEVLVLDYAAGHVARPFRPVRDDKDVANLITVRRRAGGEVTVEQVSGPLNTGDPGLDPDAAGVNDAAVDVNTASEDQLASLGQRELARGTVPGDRYPTVRINLRAPEVSAAKQAEVLGADADDRLVIQNLAAAKIFDAVDQVARGYSEVFRHVNGHEVSLDVASYEPYRTFTLDTDRFDTDGSTLAADKAAGAALPYTLSVATAAGSSLWTTVGAEFPLDVMIKGQRLTVSGVSGGASPQTFTVSARANGVDKAQSAGAKVSLAFPGVLG